MFATAMLSFANIDHEGPAITYIFIFILYHILLCLSHLSYSTIQIIPKKSVTWL
jgi:hypothetical protein